jgi:starch phosphorylase
MVRHTLQTTGPKVLASRMVRDYVHQLYTPGRVASRGLARPRRPGARAGALAARGRRALADVRVVHVEAGGVGDAPQVGTTLELRVAVDLGGLAPAT